MLKRIAVIFLLAGVVAGCSSLKGERAGKDKSAKKAAEPAELVKFPQSVGVSKLWTANAGKGEGLLGIRQAPAIADGRVYAAAVEGGVRAFDLQTGKLVWEFKPEKQKKKAKPRLSGGPGVGGGLVVVGSLDGDVIALDAATGTEKWRAKVSNEVIAAPVITQGVVLVRGNDGRVTALDAGTGERRWFNTQELPNLTVRGNAPVVVGPGVVFAGNDDGTLTAMSLQSGQTMWDQVVGMPEGRTELDRMADVDGAPVLEGTTLFATSFKGETVALEGPTGRPLWTQDHGGGGGLAVSPGLALVSDRAGTVWGLDKASGTAMWSQPALARRLLTAPAVQGDYAVVGDFDGYLHWLKLENGEFAARVRVGGKPIKAQPQVAEGILVVQNVNGDLTALRLGQ